METGLLGSPPVCPAPRSLLGFVSLILPTSPAPASGGGPSESALEGDVIGWSCLWQVHSVLQGAVSFGYWFPSQGLALGFCAPRHLQVQKLGHREAEAGNSELAGA